MNNLERKKVCILDYGVGNITSLKNSLERMGYFVSVSDKAKDLEIEEVIFLPGVGSFPYAMDNLKELELDKFLLGCFGKKNKKIIGICLGMQILFDFSEEGNREGLKIIPGKVKKFKNNECHVGWNIVTPKNNKYLQQKAGFYFNHSFYVECLPKYIQGISKYQNNFATMVKSKNFYGFQFHPEKSQNAGIHILKNIIGD